MHCKTLYQILKRKNTPQSVLPEWAEGFHLTFSLKSHQTHTCNQHLGAEARGLLWVWGYPGITVSLITAYRMRLCLIPNPYPNGVGSLTFRYSDTFRKISVSYRNGIGKATSKEFILRNYTLVKWKSYTVGRYLGQELCFHKFIFKRQTTSLPSWQREVSANTRV